MCVFFPHPPYLSLFFFRNQNLFYDLQSSSSFNQNTFPPSFIVCFSLLFPLLFLHLIPQHFYFYFFFFLFIRDWQSIFYIFFYAAFFSSFVRFWHIYWIFFFLFGWWPDVFPTLQDIKIRLNASFMLLTFFLFHLCFMF